METDQSSTGWEAPLLWHPQRRERMNVNKQQNIYNWNLHLWHQRNGILPVTFSLNSSVDTNPSALTVDSPSHSFSQLGSNLTHTDRARTCSRGRDLVWLSKAFPLSNKQNTVSEEEQHEESPQSGSIWSIASLIDSSSVTFNSVRLTDKGCCDVMSMNTDPLWLY